MIKVDIGKLTRSSMRVLPIYRLLLIIALVVAFLIGITPGRAGKLNRRLDPTSVGKSFGVKGDWVECHTVTDSRDEGENKLLSVTITEQLTGTLSGTCEATVRNVIHKDGTATFSGSGTFGGQISGRAGTAIITYSGTVDRNGIAVANWVLDKGTDDLARIDGQGTFHGKQAAGDALPPELNCRDRGRMQSVWAGTYDGTLQFSR